MQVTLYEGPSSGRNVLTNADGRFLLEGISPGRYRVVARRVGYQAEEVQLEVGPAAATVNFSLDPSVLALDALVITGTPGGNRRIALGNAVASIDLQAERQASAASGLDGILGNKVAGVQLTAPSGAVGGGTKFRVRGSSSLALSGDPIIYINGVRLDSPEAFAGRSSSVSTLADLNPADIDRIEVIKGPAASTLYGTEAANGVIQIFTRRGVSGAPRFNASVEVGSNFLQDPAGTFGPSFYKDPETGEVRSVNSYLVDEDPDFMPNAYGRPVFRSGPLQQYNFGLRGGSDLLQYAASVNLVDEQGYTRFDANKRASGRLSLSLTPSERWSATLDASQGVSDVKPGFFAQGYFLLFTPLAGRTTPMEAMLNATSNNIEGLRSTWSGSVEHNPVSWFRQRLVMGVDRNELSSITLTPKSTNPVYTASYSDAIDGRKTIDTVDRQTLTVDYVGTVNLPDAGEFASKASIGVQWYSRSEETGRLDGRVFATPALTTIDAAAQTSSSESFKENVTLGAYIQGETAWRDRLFLIAAARFDKNSAFGETASAAVYPKLSGSWAVSEEPFWNASRVGSVVSQFRVRGAWGASGQQPDIFAAHRLYEAVTGPGGRSTLTPLASGNPDLKPERGEEIELGFDAEVGRAALEFTWYSRATRDALVERRVRPSVGFPGARFENAGRVSGGGTEAALTLDVLGDAPVQWTLRSAFSTTWSKVDDLGGSGRIEVGRNQFHVEGFPLAGFFDIRVLSADFVNGTSGAVTNALCDGGTGPSGMEMGGPAVPCSEAPLVFYGRAEPKWTFALTNSFRYGPVTLTGVVDAKGGHLFNPDYLSGHNQWSSERVIRQDDPIWMALRQYGARGAQVFADGDFITLRELTLRFDLPRALNSRLGLSSGGITFTGHNVSTLWMKQGRDVDFGGRIWSPEIQSPANNYAGVNMGGQPPGSRASVRLDVTF